MMRSFSPFPALVFGLLMLLPRLSQAQFSAAKPAEMAQLKQRQLVVLYDTPSKKDRDKLAKQENTTDGAELEMAYAGHNAALDSLVRRHWSLHDTFLTMRLEDFKALGKNDKQQYAVIFTSTYEEAAYNKNFIPLGHLVLDPGRSRFAESFTHHQLNVCLGEKLDQKLATVQPQLFSIDLPESQPVASSLAFAVKLASYFCGPGYAFVSGSKSPFELMAKQNDYKLKFKTLLLRRDWLTPELTEEKAKYAYRYPVQVVDALTYDSLVLSNDPAFVYFVLVPKAVVNMNGQSYITYYYLLADNQDGALCAWYLPNIVTSQYKNQSDKVLLDEKTLKKLAELYH